MAILLILVPLAAAGLALVVPSNRWRPWLLPLGALPHLVLVASILLHPDEGQAVPGIADWLRPDPLGKLFLGFLSVLFFLCSLYAPGYLALRSSWPNRVFCANLLAVLAMMTLVTLSQHLGLMWVAMEAMTLACAPLLYFNRNTRSLEATWKYLVIGSVGIALALLGSFFLAYAALHAGLESSLFFDELLADAPQLSAPWLRAAFVLLFVGYGTKMGLAPMHTWKPDAYGEAPGMVGTLLAGGATACAFLAILRFFRICSASGDAAFAREIMTFMGLLSMAAAAIFLVRQRDFKRMLAYSSVEHMGILVLGVGIGGLAVYGALLHLLTNGLTKGVLFLSAGNIHRAYESKYVDEVQGALRRVPLSGALFLAGFLAITGSPPFGPFLSVFTIASGAFSSSQFLVGGLFLLLLGVVFVGMGTTVLAIVQGTPAVPALPEGFRDSFAISFPILLFMALVLMLGLFIPPQLDALLREAARFLEVIE
jgi:hydrogenase-4 component F